MGFVIAAILVAVAVGTPVGAIGGQRIRSPRLSEGGTSWRSLECTTLKLSRQRVVGIPVATPNYCSQWRLCLVHNRLALEKQLLTVRCYDSRDASRGPHVTGADLGDRW